MPTKFWIEKTLVAGRADRLDGPNSLGKALWSPQKSKDGKDIYRSMREIKANDVIFHFIDNKALVGVSKAKSSADTNFAGLKGTEWSDTPSYRIDLEGFTQEECALQMNIARTTVQKIYSDARKKVADSLVNSKTMLIDGGNYQVCDGLGRSCSGRGCQRHRHGRDP